MENGLVDLYVMEKKYSVPGSLTMLRAIEYAGYKLVRGAGCRGGFCGACATAYRMSGDNSLHVALACQAMVADGMHISQIPSFPAIKASYDLSALVPEGDTLLRCYPELAQCKGCNACTKACPQEIDVMEYVAACLRGDIARAADLSFDCVACGLCAARCMGELVPHYVALLARRLYGAHLAVASPHLAKRVEEIQAGQHNAAVEELKHLPTADLKKRYAAREIEP